ncbi:MAG: hypothetical protein ACLPV8_28065 [Steroidobacteraceae bacterium]
MQEPACHASRAIGVRIRTDAAGALCKFYSIVLTEIHFDEEDKTADTLSGTLTQVLLTPKGVIEGTAAEHLRLHGIEKSGLKCAKVVAKGGRQMRVLGTILLEAREITHGKIA